MEKIFKVGFGDQRMFTYLTNYLFLIYLDLEEIIL